MLQLPYISLQVENPTSMSFQFREAPNMISNIMLETCRAILAAYGNEVMQVPSTPEEWKEVARKFEQRWNFPHTLGAIDEKHICIQNPAFGGTHNFNYKEFYSVILLGVVGAEYKFQYVDVGATGSESDGGIFVKSQLGKMLDKHEANLSVTERLANETEDKPPVDYFFSGDEVFTLKKYMIKPYPA